MPTSPFTKVKKIWLYIFIEPDISSIVTIFKLINGLDDCEDVQNVFYNFEFDEKSLQILEE